MPYDSVVSIGGQSLLDGVWRILQPALQSLNNPLPVTLPGMTNAWVRVRAITPALSRSSASLTLQVDVEVLGDILLTASVKAGTVNLALPQGTINIPKPTAAGDITLPTTPITVTLPAMDGPLSLAPNGTLTLTPRTDVSITLPTGSKFNLPALTGTLNFPSGIPGNVGLPLPSVVPLTLNLTPTAPVRVPVTVPLAVAPTINQDSAFGLLLRMGTPTVSLPTLPAPGDFVTAIVRGLERLLKQLGIKDLPEELPPVDPFRDKGPTTAEITTAATNIVAWAQEAVQGVLTEALTGLTARTGRLIFPVPGAGASCETALLPTAATPQIVLFPSGPVLQVGFFRTGVSAAPLTWPATPQTAEVQITVDNAFLLGLLCCLVEKLPNFTLPFPAETETTDINGEPTDTISGTPYSMCCNFRGATVNVGPIALSGALSVCIAGASGGPKSITLVGSFSHGAPGSSPSLPLATIDVRFTLPLTFDLDDLASQANLRVVGSPRITVNVGLPDLLVLGLVVLATVSAFPFGALVGPALVGVTLGVLYAACAMASSLLNNTVRTLLRAASLVRSPVSVPPGVFEAFGKLVPATMVIDDLTANGVLSTPTTPWGLFSLEFPPDILEKPPIEGPTTTPTSPTRPTPPVD